MELAKCNSALTAAAAACCCLLQIVLAISNYRDELDGPAVSDGSLLLHYLQ
jgi:hypothetical protein